MFASLADFYVFKLCLISFRRIVFPFRMSFSSFKEVPDISSHPRFGNYKDKLRVWLLVLLGCDFFRKCRLTLEFDGFRY